MPNIMHRTGEPPWFGTNHYQSRRRGSAADVQARKFQRELSAGLTALVLLSVLAEAESDLYGYEIARRLNTEALPSAPFKQARCTLCCGT